MFLPSAYFHSAAVLLWEIMDDSTMTESGTQKKPEALGVERIGQAMSRMRIMIGRRVVGRVALQNVAPDLDISHIDVLDVIKRAERDSEVTVGTIAERMRIDPSRASRVVADMVERGVLRREASQADARRIVVVLTPLGLKLLEEIRAVKLAAIAEIVADWPQADIESFSRLFETFIGGFEALYVQREKKLQDGGSSG